MDTNKPKVWSILDLPSLRYRHGAAVVDKGQYALSSCAYGITLYKISYRRKNPQGEREAVYTHVFDLDYTGDWLAELNKKAADNKVPYTFTLTA